MTATFGEVVKAYKRVLGFGPTRYGWRPFHGLVEVDRCLLDGKLVTNKQSMLEEHWGHRMSQPVYLKPHEVLFIALGIIK